MTGSPVPCFEVCGIHFGSVAIICVHAINFFFFSSFFEGGGGGGGGDEVGGGKVMKLGGDGGMKVLP